MREANPVLDAFLVETKRTSAPVTPAGEEELKPGAPIPCKQYIPQTQ